jgi:hypothetical protein
MRPLVPVLVLVPLLGACSNVLGYGEERELVYELLYEQSAEARSGADRCEGELPPLDGSRADCDFSLSPLAGSQSVLFHDDGFVDCSSCWEQKHEIWAELLLRIEMADNYVALPFEPNHARPAAELIDSTTGALVYWSNGGLGLYCVDFGFTPQTRVELGRSVKVGYHFDWETSRGELWLDAPETARSSLFGRTPDETITCEKQAWLPTGWLARGNIKPLPGSGSFVIDEIRIADSRDAMLLAASAATTSR